MIKIEKVKQRVSAVAYVTLRREVIWIQTNRTKAFYASWGEGWAGSASLGAGIQVDLMTGSGHCSSIQ